MKRKASGDLVLLRLLQRFPEAVVTIQVARELLDSGADVNQSDVEGTTPLFFAYTLPMCEMLLKRGANPNVTNRAGRTPLECQLQDENWDVARLLFPITTLPSWYNDRFCKLATEFAAIITMALLKRRGTDCINKDVRTQIGKYIFAERRLS